LRFTKLDEPKLRLESPPRFRPVIPLLPRRELPIPPKFRLAKLAVAGLPRFAEIAPEPIRPTLALPKLRFAKFGEPPENPG
jgi:hypothetical protein